MLLRLAFYPMCTFVTLLCWADTYICMHLKNSSDKGIFTESKKLARSNHLILLFTLRMVQGMGRSLSAPLLLSFTTLANFCDYKARVLFCLFPGLALAYGQDYVSCPGYRLPSLTLNRTPLQRGFAFPSSQHVWQFTLSVSTFLYHHNRPFPCSSSCSCAVSTITGQWLAWERELIWRRWTKTDSPQQGWPICLRSVTKAKPNQTQIQPSPAQGTGVCSSTLVG